MDHGLRFAVPAPGGVELDEHVLGVIEDDILVVVRDDDGDGAVLLFGDGLGLDARVNLAGYEVVDEGANVLVGDLFCLVVGEFLVLGDVLDGEGGPSVDLEVQVAGVGAEGFGVDGGEVDGAFVLGCGFPEGFAELFSLFGGLGEDVGERKAGLEHIIRYSGSR